MHLFVLGIIVKATCRGEVNVRVTFYYSQYLSRWAASSPTTTGHCKPYIMQTNSLIRESYHRATVLSLGLNNHALFFLMLLETDAVGFLCV